MTDGKLWDAFRSGDKSALRTIYEEHFDALMDYGCRYCQDLNLVEDHLHDLFVYIWKNRERLGSTDSIRAYLLLSLRRSIIKGTKRNSKIKSIGEDESYHFHLESAVEDQIIEDESVVENRALLGQALGALSGRQREAIYLKYYKEMEYSEISEVMGINYQSVRNLIFNGLKALRKSMVLILVQIFLWLV